MKKAKALQKIAPTIGTISWQQRFKVVVQFHEISISTDAFILDNVIDYIKLNTNQKEVCRKLVKTNGVSKLTVLCIHRNQSLHTQRLSSIPNAAYRQHIRNSKKNIPVTLRICRNIVYPFMILILINWLSNIYFR